MASGKRSLFARFKDRISQSSQTDSLRPISNSKGPSQISLREESPDSNTETFGSAKFAVVARSSSALSVPKADDNKDVKSGAKAAQPSQPATNTSKAIDFWTIAEAELLKDPQKREKLERYNLILEKRLGSKLEPSGTPERRKQVLHFLSKEIERFNSTDSQTRLSKFKRKAGRFFKSTVDFVVATQSIISTAASPCLPASAACAGVAVLLSVSMQPGCWTTMLNIH
jgi:hypothetical protein